MKKALLFVFMSLAIVSSSAQDYGYFLSDSYVTITRTGKLWWKFDTTTFFSRHHTLSNRWHWYKVLSSSETFFPFTFRISDTTAAKWGMSITNNSWTNGPAGATNYVDQTMQFGYNVDGEDVTQPSFGISAESKYYVSTAWHSEFHTFFNGVVMKLGVRPFTFIGRWGDGRVTSMGNFSDLIYYSNGGGDNGASQDSLTGRWVMKGFGQLGRLDLFNGTFIRSDAANSTLFQGFNGTTYGNVVSTGGNTQLYFGAANWTDINLQAGAKTFTLNQTGVISQNIFVAANSADSSGVLGYNEFGWLVKRWLVTLPQVNLRISAALDSAFTLTGRKLNIRNLGLALALSGADTNRTLVWNATAGEWQLGWKGAAGVTQINTSAPITGGPITTTGTIGITQATTSTDGYLSSTDWNTFNDKASRPNIRDSLRKNVYLQDYWTGEGMIDGRYDSTKLGLIDAMGLATSYSYNWSSHQELFTTNDVVMIDRITLRHSCDSIFTSGGASSVAFWRYRDTTFFYTIRDSIPAGAKVFAYYSPASDMTIWNSTKSQVVGIFYMMPNDNTAYLIGNKVQVPIIVDNTGTAGRKVVSSQAGYRTSIGYNGGLTQYNHMLRVNVRVHRKVIGLDY